MRLIELSSGRMSITFDRDCTRVSELAYLDFYWPLKPPIILKKLFQIYM